MAKIVPYFFGTFLLCAIFLGGCSSESTPVEMNYGIEPISSFAIESSSSEILFESFAEGSSDNNVSDVVYDNQTLKDSLSNGTLNKDSAVSNILKGIASATIPLKKGAVVEVFELDSVAFDATGTVFRDTLEDDDGRFSVDVSDLKSRYVFISVQEDTTVSKYLKNEVKAIVDVSRNRNIYVNVMTHMEYRRCLYLLKNEHMSFEEAKKIAERDVLKAFYIEADIDKSESLNLVADNASDIILCAIAMLVASEYDYVSENLEKDGVWEEDSLKAGLADRAKYNTIHNPNTNILGSLSEFEMTAIQYGNSGLAIYPIYRNFWIEEYGMGGCSSKNKGEVKQRAWNKLYYTCRENVYYDSYMFWFVSTDLEKATAGKKCEAGDNYAIYDKSDNMYVCDSLKWRNALVIEKENGVCTSELEGLAKEDSLGFEYECQSGKWKYNFKYFKDGRNDNEYRYLLVGPLYWMLEDLLYYDSVATSNLIGNMHYWKGTSVENAYYKWNAAMDLDSSYNSRTAKDVVSEKHRGICPEGWRVPSSEDWKLLMDAIGENYNVVVDLGLGDYFNSSRRYWSSTENNDSLAEIAFFDLTTINVPSVRFEMSISVSGKSKEKFGAEERAVTRSLRCVKDLD